jgi:hypothetical protein
MTSTTNARGLEQLRQARGEARERFARQMKLLAQLEATAAERETVTRRWRVQLAALAELAGGASLAAAQTGLAKAEVEAAVRAADRAAINETLEALRPAQRRRRAPVARGVAGSAGDGAAP